MTADASAITGTAAATGNPKPRMSASSGEMLMNTARRSKTVITIKSKPGIDLPGARPVRRRGRSRPCGGRLVTFQGRRWLARHPTEAECEQVEEQDPQRHDGVDHHPRLEGGHDPVATRTMAAPPANPSFTALPMSRGGRPKLDFDWRRRVHDLGHGSGPVLGETLAEDAGRSEDEHQDQGGVGHHVLELAEGRDLIAGEDQAGADRLEDSKTDATEHGADDVADAAENGRGEGLDPGEEP